ncbi:hypothetical protein NP493_776g00000 [Ridgeia piscesae]|uniref:Uncharacterized protein n=1 Tax=Ridgeia piscesae TaxID=27915 RepID=A0AAD9KNH1_RIDPI|nr:hypothetical protein NP493_776g00000 [Ridgeia piscesae]
MYITVYSDVDVVKRMRMLEMAARGAGVSLLKQGWQEVPDLVGSLAVGVFVIRSADVDDPKKLGTIYN